jgi:hypothetical protein
LTAPGWYPDPGGSSAKRYWDGLAWHDAIPTRPGPQAPKPPTNWKLAAGVTAAAVAVVLALVVVSRSNDHTPPPGVSGTDAAFLQAIHDRGITNDGGDTALIALAHGVCDQLRSGQSVDGIAEHWGLTSQRMSTESARFYVRTAAAAYCPQRL